jgi:hypothetical protein
MQFFGCQSFFGIIDPAFIGREIEIFIVGYLEWMIIKPAQEIQDVAKPGRLDI